MEAMRKGLWKYLGLYGVLIVEDPEPPPYTTDAIWILDDWRLTPRGDEIDPNFNTRNDLAHDGRWGNVIAVNGSLSEELAVDAGERIRLRILNSANGRVFKPDFSRLDARVIAVDGNYVEEPFPFENFEIAPGNRVCGKLQMLDRGRRLAVPQQHVAEVIVRGGVARILGQDVS